MPPCPPWNFGRGTAHRKGLISMARNESGNRMSAILLADESPQSSMLQVNPRLGPGRATQWLTRPLSKPGSPCDCGLGLGSFAITISKCVWKFTERTSLLLFKQVQNSYSPLRPPGYTHTLIIYSIKLLRENISMAMHTHSQNTSCFDHMLQYAEGTHIYSWDLQSV